MTLGEGEAPRAALRRPVVAVGVFDGVHRGHQDVLQALRARAAARGGEAVVLTFDPHPRAVVTGQGPPLLTTLAHRVVLLGRAGADAVVVLPFTREVAGWEPEEFVRRVLAEGLGAAAVLMGEDHRFGRGRRGDLALLRRLGAEHGFETEALPLTAAGEEVVSSTAVRRAVAEADLAAAAHLLGRPASVMGPVVPGDRRGRTLGFPTANLDLDDAVRPPAGVYAARARVVTLPDAQGRDGEGPLLPAVVNVGRRPTFHRDAPALVEVHLLEGGRDLYGEQLEVLFLSRLRAERRFEGPDQLQAQIRADAAAARAALAASDGG